MNELLDPLKRLGFVAVELPESEELPLPAIGVYLSGFDEEPERIAHVMVMEQLLPNPTASMTLASYSFPFQVNSLFAPDVARLVALFNSGQELVQFLFNEIEQQVSVRFTLLSDERIPSATLLAAGLGLLSQAIDLYGEALRQVAVGESSFLEHVEKNVQFIEELMS